MYVSTNQINSASSVFLIALEDVLNHPDASLDICVSAIRDAYRHGCKDMAIDALQIFKRKSVVSSDKEKLDQLHLVSTFMCVYMLCLWTIVGLLY